ncbi:metal-dependent phosphohydrolase [Psychromonas sp. psych-6C06]|uniref:HD-GYP domain-containing protein n=1 Tax=Psychromonas sp. psych-6C06 TaxID=2058089 RepID=UPI000C33221D|nr:HD domain-containing phosphohydrolase [Psychromonas sp. psych-6C06]PKF62186.1 metal-dependent phosphohydrolase [Psychromonas sp. psych-6C06]
MLINLSKRESTARIIIATIFIAIGTHSHAILLMPMGIILLYTGLTHKCWLSRLINRQTQAAQENLFIHYLPKYNPQPVFIFKADSSLLFCNSPAKKQFPHISHFNQLIEKPINTLIKKEKIETHTLTIDDKITYSLVIRGTLALNGVTVYASDISEVIHLNQEILDTQKEIIYAMGEIGETRSKETGDHVRRVAEYSELLAQLTGISESEASLIKLASPMHDIGKVGIPDAILKKPGKLTADEFEVMKTHAEIGYDLLNHSKRPVLKAAAIISYQHHEKWDGTGYPQQLSGEDIHIYGRITAIADVFDALGSDRVYKKAWPIDEILDFFTDQQGKHFDPALVSLLKNNLTLFLDIKEKYPN